MPTKRNVKSSERKTNKKKNADRSGNEKLEKSPSKNEEKETNNTKMTLCTIPAVSCRSQIRERRPGRPPSGKRLSMIRDMPAKVRSALRRSLDPCDNSNDSGLGFDHHSDLHHSHITPERITSWSAEPKRPRLDIKLEHDEINDAYCFPETIRTCKESTALIRTAPASTVPSLSMTSNQSSTSGRVVPRCVPLSNRQTSSSPVALTTQLNCSSRYMDVSLTIVKQPEQQHRARYQTEGSRGAVKDREGSGFPIVQLTGYYKPTTLQVFIGTDVGKVAPHMFYQACKVSGKNSTPCVEKKIDGTCVIELQLDPSKEMSATCDCVGILKERNVDVEHRFPDQLGNRSKKKSTRCRMIFRTTLTHDDGTIETLQVCSQPIVCTQPPGIPEICKKSLTSCPASGGLELFVLGKNFLKDTKVFFQQIDDDRHIRWEQAVVPDKEYLQQTHFVCVVPPYRRPDITEPVTVRLCVVSSGKTSESHQFVYTPVNGAIPSGAHATIATTITTTSTDSSSSIQQQQQQQQSQQQTQFFNKMLWPSSISKREQQDVGMMPPPETNLVPLSSSRRTSISSIQQDIVVHSPLLRTMKQEFLDDNSQNSLIDSMDIHQQQERYRHISESSLDVHPGDSNMSIINDNSMDMINNNGIINNDNSNEAQHCNRLNRQLCENSMDVNLSDSQMSTINDENSCNSILQCTQNNNDTNGLVLSQQGPIMHSQIISSTNNCVTAEELKVIDLRMKMPMATVADLVSSTAPSMATLHSLGVTESSTLPAQSAQSIETFLTNIESKPIIPTTQNLNTIEENAFQQKLLSPPVIHKHIDTNEPIYPTSPHHLINSSTIQNENTIHMVAKSEAAAVAEHQQSIVAAAVVVAAAAAAVNQQQTNVLTTTINSNIDRTTEKLDQLINSTVDSHIGNVTNDVIDVVAAVTATTSTTTVTDTTNPIITTHDVMLNSQTALVVPTIINTTTLTSPVLNTTHLNTNNNNHHQQQQQQQQQQHNHHMNNNQIVTTTTLSPDVILNSQISPSLMCRNNQDITNSLNSSVVDTNLLSTNQNQLLTNNEPEKVVILKAAVDFLETQKKLSELSEPNTQLTSAITNNDNGNQLNTFVQNQQFVTNDNNKTNDFVIPIPVKEMTGVEKKNEDRMIPQSFTSLTENELINLINPSCFDQV